VASATATAATGAAMGAMGADEEKRVGTMAAAAAEVLVAMTVEVATRVVAREGAAAERVAR
tara:strand:- start:541 stop:723 length:183 start_codon:yes stop_codon:yes gene_type:complete